VNSEQAENAHWMEKPNSLVFAEKKKQHKMSKLKDQRAVTARNPLHGFIK
jgi:hypothetical protein